MIQRSEAVILVVGVLLTALGVAVFALGHGRQPPTVVVRGIEGDRTVSLWDRPRSSLVVLVQGTEGTIPDAVRGRVAAYAEGRAGADFPLGLGGEDAVRSLDGLASDVLLRWQDNMTPDRGFLGVRAGSGASDLAFFGDGWDSDWAEGEGVGRAPYWAGDGQRAWMWSSHESMATGEGNALPSGDSKAVGQPYSLALWLRRTGVLRSDILVDRWLGTDVDTFVRWHGRQTGGSWFRIEQHPETGVWECVEHEDARRYDAGASTLLRLTAAHTQTADHEEAGVVRGTAGCRAGLPTPWGTFVAAEGSTAGLYGDLEACWTEDNDFDPVGDGAGYAAGRLIVPSFEADAKSELGRISAPGERRARDVHGWLAEIDPGRPPSEFLGSKTDGDGHRKLGAFGRARWQDLSIALGVDWQLLEDRPLVLYASNGRSGGRIYKWVSSEPFRRGMTKSAVRGLLDDGTLFVAHVEGLDNRTGLHHRRADLVPDRLERPTAATPLSGRWIRIALDSEDLAPNGPALGNAAQTVGAALRDLSWNGIGGFADDLALRKNLFTAAMKIGVMELNRPAGLAWNPVEGRLVLALVGEGRTPGLDADGVLDRGHARTEKRPDREGAIWVVEEADGDPLARTFTCHQIWQGWTLAQVDPQGAAFVPTADPRVVSDPRFVATHADALLIDRAGGVWFGTDGSFARSGGRVPDGLYYLDLRGGSPTEGLAFRVASSPSDAAVKGPCLAADQRSLFFNAQHPGQDLEGGVVSHWPPRRDWERVVR